MKAHEEDTVLLFRPLHNTARVFANKVAKEAYVSLPSAPSQAPARGPSHCIVCSRCVYGEPWADSASRRRRAPS